MNQKLPALNAQKSKGEVPPSAPRGPAPRPKSPPREPARHQSSSKKLIINFSLNPDEIIQEGVKNLIHEYLVKTNMVRTLEVFKEEVVGSPPRPQPDYQELLLHYFDQASRPAFFDVWKKYVPLSLRIHDKETIKLEFFANLYFITAKLGGARTTKRSAQTRNFRIDRKPRAAKNGEAFSFTDAELESNGQLVKQSMMELKTFLANNGEELSKIEELLPYYALPYLKDPYSHPLFKDIFTEKWKLNIREQLADLLANLYPARSKPFLVQMYENSLRAGDQQETLGASSALRPRRPQSNAPALPRARDKENLDSPATGNDETRRSFKSASELKHGDLSCRPRRGNSSRPLADDQCLPSINPCESIYYPSQKVAPPTQPSPEAEGGASLKAHIAKLEDERRSLAGYVELLGQKIGLLETELEEANRDRQTAVAQAEDKWLQPFKDLMALALRLLEFANIFRNGREQFLDIVGHRLTEYQALLGGGGGRTLGAGPSSRPELPTTIDDIPGRVVSFLRRGLTRPLLLPRLPAARRRPNPTNPQPKRQQSPPQIDGHSNCV